jgi:transposase
VELGFTCATSIVRAWVAQFKPTPNPDPIVRFETDPGQQMQADFTIIHKGAKPLMALVATMGFSRAGFARFTVSEDPDTLVDCLKMAFDYFGGVPNEVLFDNAKSVIIARDFYGQGQHRWNDKLLALADQTGFKLCVCRPYRSAPRAR